MILSICVPTYNRSSKALRTVKSFYEQLLLSDHKAEIELVVSNNCSPDDTKQVLDGLDFPGINFRVFHQTKNLGFDGNTKFLYVEAKGQYVWYFGDDDIIFDGAVDTVFNSIKEGKYGAMRFSFMQPIGDPDLGFNLPANTANVVTDMAKIVAYCFTLPKVSTYVLKRVEPLDVFFSPISEYEDHGYWFLALSVRVFEYLGAKSGGMLVYTRQLASCDDDIFEELNVPPQVWNNRTVIADYPFVKQHNPRLAPKLFKDDYRYTIFFLWNFKTGEYVVHNPEENDHFIKDFKIRLLLLASRRDLLRKILILKLNRFPLFAKMFNLNKRAIS